MAEDIIVEDRNGLRKVSNFWKRISLENGSQ